MKNSRQQEPKSRDTWCCPVPSRHGNVVSGGAARNVRIADLGGMDELVAAVARQIYVLANEAAIGRACANFRLVSNR